MVICGAGAGFGLEATFAALPTGFFWAVVADAASAGTAAETDVADVGSLMGTFAKSATNA